MSDGGPSSLWPILHYDDPDAARRFLVDVVGFREAVVIRDDEGDIVHAELRWPGGGVLLFGGTKHTDSVHGGLKAGALYLVTDHVDAVHVRVRDAGGDVVQAPCATEFGAGGPAYAFSTRDTEGNLWTFGTYRGAAWPPQLGRSSLAPGARPTVTETTGRQVAAASSVVRPAERLVDHGVSERRP